MPAKHSRTGQVFDRGERVKITIDMIARPLRDPRYQPPYFTFEALDPDLYAGELAAASCLDDLKDVIPYDIEGTYEEEPSEEEDDEEDIELNFAYSLSTGIPDADSVRNASSKSPPPSLSDANRVVVGPRPVEGRGRKLCDLENMDEDDKLIYYLKLAKWTERAIREKFVAEGRINYNQKTIGTRFARMRRMVMAENDKRLEDGTADWLEAENKLLPQAVEFATQQIEAERVALQQRKWKLVSDYIQKREPLALYSPEACRKRYEAKEGRIYSHGAIRKRKMNETAMEKLRQERQQQAALLERFQREAL